MVQIAREYVSVARLVVAIRQMGVVHVIRRDILGYFVINRVLMAPTAWDARNVALALLTLNVAQVQVGIHHSLVAFEKNVGVTIVRASQCCNESSHSLTRTRVNSRPIFEDST